MSWSGFAAFSKRVCLQGVRTLGMISKAGVGGCSARPRGISIGETGFPRHSFRYNNEGVAHREAELRIGEGKKDVRFYQNRMRISDERREYRNIRLLAERLDFDMPERAWNNSEYEYIFLHHVQDSAVVGWIYL